MKGVEGGGLKAPCLVNVHTNVRLGIPAQPASTIETSKKLAIPNFCYPVHPAAFLFLL